MLWETEEYEKVYKTQNNYAREVVVELFKDIAVVYQKIKKKGKIYLVKKQKFNSIPFKSIIPCLHLVLTWTCPGCTPAFLQEMAAIGSSRPM